MADRCPRCVHLDTLLIALYVLVDDHVIPAEGRLVPVGRRSSRTPSWCVSRGGPGKISDLPHDRDRSSHHRHLMVSNRPGPVCQWSTIRGTADTDMGSPFVSALV